MRKLQDNKIRWLVVIALVLMLAGVRAFEDVLFYDPLLDYYRADFTAMPWPETDSLRLAFSLTSRYFLNTIFSLAIIYAIFRNGSLIRFTAMLYLLFFFILMALFFAAFTSEADKMLVFNIRRFIIQPIFLLLFVPAFYFQERAAKKNNIS